MRLCHSLVLCLVLIAAGGRALAGPLVAQPVAIQFPDVGVGAQSPAQLVTFTNNGNQAVTVSGMALGGANPGDFTLEPPLFPPPFSIGAGAGFTATVKCAPQVGGARSATLIALLGGGLGDTTVTLTCKAIGQKLTVTPSPINAGGTKLNVTISIKVSVQNSGGGSVKVGNVSLSGPNANEFAISGAPQYPALLGPAGAGSFAITVQCTPNFQGRHDAILNVASDDPNLGPNLPVPITCLAGDPKIAVDVGTISFGNVRLGFTSAPQVVNVMNVGNSDLTVSLVALDGVMGMPNDFVLDRAMLPNNSVIPAMAQRPLTASCRPQALGQRLVRIVIVTDDPGAPATYVTLLCTGTSAKLSGAPNVVDFGDVTAFLGSKPTSIVLSNAGNADANLTGINVNGANRDWFRANGILALPLKIPAGGSAKVNLIALPLGLGVGTGTATLFTDDPGLPQFDVPMKVRSVVGVLSLTPSFGDFGTVGVLAKATMSFTLKNVGAGALHLVDFRLEDPMQCACMQLVNAPQPDAMGKWPELAPGQALTFSVLFSPQVEGVFNAEITIDTDDPMARHIHVPLTGAGSQKGPGNGTQSLSFGALLVGSTSPPQLAMINNTGGAELRIRSLSLAGANPNQFHFEDPGPFTLSAGQTRAVPVTYQPVTAGMHAASLVITPEGFAPAQIKLTGMAFPPVVQFSPTLVDFDVLGVPLPVDVESNPFKVALQVPPSGIAVTLGEIRSSNPRFRVDTSMTQLALAPGQPTTFAVTFRPTTYALETSTISVFARGVDKPLITMQARGTGTRGTALMPVIAEPGCTIGSQRALGSGGLAVVLALPLLGMVLRRRRRQPLATR